MINPKCSQPGCEQSALILTDPPRCFEHEHDIDTWYERMSSRFKRTDSAADNLEALVARATLFNLYRESIFRDREGATLYKDYKNRIEPSDDVQFSFADVVYFVIAAAASGIIGNAAYDAIRAFLSKFPGSRRLTENFNYLIIPPRPQPATPAC